MNQHPPAFVNDTKSFQNQKRYMLGPFPAPCSLAKWTHIMYSFVSGFFHATFVFVYIASVFFNILFGTLSNIQQSIFAVNSHKSAIRSYYEHFTALGFLSHEALHLSIHLYVCFIMHFKVNCRHQFLSPKYSACMSLKSLTFVHNCCPFNIKFMYGEMHKA